MSSPALDRYVIETIQAGSKSFAVASKLFDTKTRRSVLMLYAWCRYCDDTIDNQQLGFTSLRPETTTSEQRLEMLKTQTAAAFAGNAMQEPAFIALQQVAIQHSLSQKFADDHLQGYAMDVAAVTYSTIDQTLAYCYHVAGVVGLMMAQIMGGSAESTLDRACDLGLAFQLTNIARDIVEDADIGRCYIPESWLIEEGLTLSTFALPEHRAQLSRVACRMIDYAERYYRSAYDGLSGLPIRSAWAIATARRVYRQIGIEIKNNGAGAWQQRVSTSGLQKALLLLMATGDVILSRFRAVKPRSSTLWQRP